MIRRFLRGFLVWALLIVIMLFLLFSVVTCKVDEGILLSDDFSIVEETVEKMATSNLYKIVNIQSFNGHYWVTYRTRDAGILFWQRDIYKQEKQRLGLPQK